MSGQNDTIVALATPVGTSALALVRLSGSEARTLANRLLRRPPTPRAATHTVYRDRDGRVLDDVVITFFEAPRSFTGEPTLEITCHGNPLIAQLILSDTLNSQCRMAEPGEFSRRAFLSGRLDLSQAEAIMDLISARSLRALDAANQQLRGSLGQHLSTLVDSLISVVAQVEAYIDFPEDDLPAEDARRLAQQIADVLRGTQRLLATHRYGELLRDGIKTVILGDTNAGKSSLLNRLLGRERALVSPEAGTTRDFIEEPLLLGEHAIRLIDTAGLNPSAGHLEQRGIAQTLARAAEADLVLWVVDASHPLPSPSPEIQPFLRPGRTFRLLNKSDLLPPHAASPARLAYAGITDIPLSALTGDGLERLTQEITQFAESFRQDVGVETIAINARHADALQRAQNSLEESLRKLQAQSAAELLASDLRAALNALGEISGKIDNEQILDRLFASFCIGK